MQQSASNFSSHNSSISAKSYLYIWLINKQFFFRKTYEEQKQFTTSIIYNKDRYDIELTAKYTHDDYISSSSITYCDIKFLKRNGIEITHVNGFTHQERSLSNCIREYNKLVDKEFKMSFIFKIKSKYAFDYILNVFDNVVEYVNFDNNRYEIKIQHEDPLITCYYYCFVRFYLETSSMLRQYNLQRTTLSESMKYYLSSSSSWFSNLLENVLSPFTYNFNKNNEMDVVIDLPFLGDNKTDIYDNKIQLEEIYDDFHNIVSAKLSDYIFNKYSIKPLYLNINDSTSYVDNRVNIYCNPFNVLYYHICVINDYVLHKKKELVQNKYVTTNYKLINLLNNNGYDINKFTNNTDITLSTDLLINIATIRYFYNYFNINAILDEHENNYEYELIDCDELIKLFNKINLTLTYDYESFETKIKYIATEITGLGIFEYALYEKYKSVYLFEIIIEQLKSYSKSSNLVIKLLSIYENYKKIDNDDVNELIYNCLTEASKIIINVEDDYLPPVKLLTYIDELNELYAKDYYTIIEITLLYHKLLEALKEFEFNVEYKEMLLQANIADEMATETNSDDEIVIDNENTLLQSENDNHDTFEHINETNIDTSLNNNTLNINTQKTKKYYISSWLGF